MGFLSGRCSQVFHVGKWRSMDDVDIMCCIQEQNMDNNACKKKCKDREGCVYAFYEEGVTDGDVDTCILVSSIWQQNQLVDGNDRQQIVKLTQCVEPSSCDQSSTSKDVFLFLVCFCKIADIRLPFSVCSFVHLFVQALLLLRHMARITAS